MKLFFDTETTGLAKFNLPPEHPSQPRMVQLGMILIDDQNEIVNEVGLVIKPDGYIISEQVASIHGISQERAMKYGVPVSVALALFMQFHLQAETLIGHNIKFDKLVLQSEFARYFEKAGVTKPTLFNLKEYCTMLESTNICKLSNKFKSGYKWPKLSEAYNYFFHEELLDAHDALTDVRATVRVYIHLTTPAKKSPQLWMVF